jgi:sugar/nucleoside kinase (ribokinase family)
MAQQRRETLKPYPKPSIPQVVCFGMLTPVAILVVDELPAYNCGALVQDASEFIFDDAAIVACLLRQWDVRSGLIGTTLGNDYRGRSIARQLKAMGVLGKVRLSSHFTTPIEVDVSDRTGARTYFWQRKPKVLDTLDTADLSLLQGSRLLYVDWYDGDHILRAMDEASRLDIPVFLNLEHGHQDPNILSRYVRRAAICQAVTDPAQCGECDPLTVAHKLLDAGAKIAIVTLACDGCLVARGKNSWRVWPPEVQVVDGCGAGATFSTGFIYGVIRGWTMEDTVRFATAAASLKVAQVGLAVEPVAKVKRLARQLKVERGV